MSRCAICERNARRLRAEEKAEGADPGRPDRNGRLVRFTEEERQRRSEVARRLHAEGRFGGAVIGARGGRSVNRHRISDAVLDYFRGPDEQQMVIDAYRSALKGKNKSLRVRAADAIMKIDKDVADRERANRGGAVDPAGMTGDELVEFVQQGIVAMLERGDIDLADVVLGEDSVQDVS